MWRRCNRNETDLAPLLVKRPKSSQKKQDEKGHGAEIGGPRKQYAREHDDDSGLESVFFGRADDTPPESSVVPEPSQPPAYDVKEMWRLLRMMPNRRRKLVRHTDEPINRSPSCSNYDTLDLQRKNARIACWGK
jgi:hypothetical protein